MPAETEFERTLERETGETIESLRDTPIAERRRRLEKKHGRRMRFICRFPFIGRGNIQRLSIVSRDDVEAGLDRALR